MVLNQNNDAADLMVAALHHKLTALGIYIPIQVKKDDIIRLYEENLRERKNIEKGDLTEGNGTSELAEEAEVHEIST